MYKIINKYNNNNKIIKKTLHKKINVNNYFIFAILIIIKF